MFPVPEHGKGVLHSSVWDLSTPPVASSSQDTPAGPSETTVPKASASSEENVGETVEAEETVESKWKKTSSLPEGIEPGTVDIAVMIFVMSALHPMEWQRAIANAYKVSFDES
jgi:tRNAThr (cytosine32-N3)-methyltransferase